MWENFKSMPLLLKFLTGHAFVCLALLVVSAIPNNSFSIRGHAVSYSEWWSSGAGPFASLLGLVGPIIGVLLLTKSSSARLAYLGFLVLGLIVPYPFMGVPAMALAGIAVVCVTAVYLYKWQPVQLYFAP
jgi:hypothetical protein